MALGFKDIPCIIADDLSPEQVRAFRLTDNKTSEFATWDYEMLQEELSQLSTDMIEFGFIDVIDHDFSGTNSGASPWDRMNGESKTDDVLFSFGCITCKLPVQLYERFKEASEGEDMREWLVTKLSALF